MAQATTATLTSNMATYFDAKLLMIATPLLKHEQFCTPKSVVQGAGKTVSYTRYNVPANSTSLAEGVNVTTAIPTSTSVTATLIEEGYAEQVSELLARTNIDTMMTERIDSGLAAHAGNTLDQRARDEMYNGATTTFANGRANAAAITASDVLNTTNVRKANRLLKSAFAPLRKDTGRYAAVISEFAELDLTSDATWVGAKQYSDVNDLYTSYIGTWLNFDFVVSNQGKTEASTVTVYSNFFMGEEAVAKLELSGSGTPKVYVKTSDDHDTSQPLPMFMTMGWKAIVTYKTLNSAYIVNMKSASAG